jgi:hypothetical protein
MTERRSEHDPASDPPGAVSNPNGEENQSGHRDDKTHPEPRVTGKEPHQREPPDPDSGAAGEGSQSTGYRPNAG